MDIIKRYCCNTPCISGRDDEIVEGVFVRTFRTNCVTLRPEMDGAKKIVIKNAAKWQQCELNVMKNFPGKDIKKQKMD